MKSICIDGREFRRLVRLLGFARHSKMEEARYRNVLMRSTTSGHLEMIMTNGCALTWAKVPVASRGGEEFSMIVPYLDIIRACKAFAVLAKDGQLEITSVKKHAIFTWPMMRVKIEQSSDSFPKFEKMIGQCNFSRTCRVDSAAFNAACTILHPIKNEPRVQISFDPTKTGLWLSIPKLINILLPFTLPAGGDAMEIGGSRTHLCRAASVTRRDKEIQFCFSDSLLRMEVAGAALFTSHVKE